MLTSHIQKSLLGLLLVSALLTSACAKKDEVSVAVSERGTETGTVGENNTHTCSNDSMVWGAVYEPMGDAQFKNQVRGFVSATLNPDEIGTISATRGAKTGVDFNASFKFDSEGKLVADSSTVVIRIRDSWVGQNYNGHTIQPYAVEFMKASTGYIDRVGRMIAVTFEDSFGKIIFEGRISNDNTAVEGVVRYENKVAVAGYTAVSGKLGSFSGNACAMIK